MGGQGYQKEADMAQESEIALASLLSPYRAFITYQPLRTEVAFDFVSFPESAHIETIPPRASLDPAEEAIRLTALMGEQPVLMLIPGRLFDTSGTRHGQGGGWYDRFLSQVPGEWLRIGICYEDQFSTVPLVRENWDQSMDYVVVVGRSGGLTLYSTDAGAVL